MKSLVTTIAFASALALSVQAADVSTKLSGVHLCCGSCVKGVEAAVAKVPGVTASVDKDAGTVSLSAAEKGALHKAVGSLVAAGYFGKSSDAGIKVNAHTGAKGQKVQSLKVSNVHLCCGKCVTAVADALKSVDGVKANTAAKGVETFEITGDFNDKDVFAALHKAGLTGHIAK